MNYNNAGGVVAVGSGSVMDVAKAVSLMLANEDIKDPKKFDGKANTKNKSFPLFAALRVLRTRIRLVIFTFPSKSPLCKRGDLKKGRGGKRLGWKF